MTQFDTKFNTKRSIKFDTDEEYDRWEYKKRQIMIQEDYWGENWGENQDVF